MALKMSRLEANEKILKVFREAFNGHYTTMMLVVAGVVAGFVTKRFSPLWPAHD